MENKNPKFELEPNRKVYFQLGLFIVGTVTLMAFTYKTPVYLTKKTTVDQIAEVPVVFEEKIDEPIIEIPEVQKLPNQTPTTPIVPNDFLSNVDPIKSSNLDPKIVISSTAKDPVIVDPFNVNIGDAPTLTEVVNYPDFVAKFDGNWTEFLGGELKYPEESIIFNESGTAYVSFVVELDGSVTDVKVLNQNLPKALQEEAIRVVKASPNWIPGSKNGENVRSTKKVRINFVLR
ncbi:TonB family protein [Brumimicrobium sp.]|uniref:energy transducer TonB n=1 Tax=Brumimicrobium sp. TaxID=2029867 RepID=UPI003A8DD05E